MLETFDSVTPSYKINRNTLNIFYLPLARKQTAAPSQNRLMMVSSVSRFFGLL